MGGPGGGGGGGGVFGGPIGPFRLLDSSLGAQAGWLLGFALVSGIAILVGSRLRRGDARTGWLIATGGAFLGCAVVFSVADGIFHPYYVSLLAPFTAALVGGGVGQFLRGDRSTLWLAPVAVVIGGVVELVVLNNTSGAPGWASTADHRHRHRRGRGDRGGVVEAGPDDRARGRADRPARRAGDVGGADARPRHQRHVPRGRARECRGLRRPGRRPDGRPRRRPGRHAGTFGPPNGAAPAAPTGGANGPARAAAGGGGPFGGNSAALTEALAYVKAHGGGTIGVSSQQGAASAIIESGADVAGIGGFSGRESQVSVAWLKQAVADGRIRWVLVDGQGGGMPQDGRTGSQTVMDWVQANGQEVSDGLYLLSGTSQVSS